MKTNKLWVVLDTNVLLVAVLEKHIHFWISERLLTNDYNLLISNDIVSEYAEKLTEKYGQEQADFFLKQLLKLPNVFQIRPRYFWRLIYADPDDDNPMLWCPVCSKKLETLKCKLFCRDCGYYMSCADYY